MNVIQNATLPHAMLPGIDHQTLAGSAQGLANLSIWKQTIEPRGATPPHRHDCEEVVLIQSGHGELHLGGQVLRFSADSTLVIPRNATHQIVNTGAEPLALIGVFAVSPVAVFSPDGDLIDLPWAS